MLRISFRLNHNFRVIKSDGFYNAFSLVSQRYRAFLRIGFVVRFGDFRFALNTKKVSYDTKNGKIIQELL